MTHASAVMATLRTDGLRLRRDRFLVGLSLYILALSIAMRWAIPLLTTSISARWGLDITPYHPLIASHILIQLAPFLAGMIGTFLLLESREERTLQALLVTPFGAASHLRVSGTAMVVAATVLVMIEGPLIGIGLPPMPALLVAGLAGAPTAPIIAMVVAGLARNKTEAFAWLKIVGLAPLIATGAWFVPEPWQWLAGIYPGYWAAKAYWLAEAGHSSWPLWAAGGVAMGAVWLALASRFFLRAVRT